MQGWVRTTMISVVIAGSVSACATVTRGTRQDFTVASQPPGATARFSDGGTTCITPCTVPMKRDAEFVVTLNKPGYQGQSVRVTHEMSTGGGVALVGNALVGGLVGVAVDLPTGATQNLVPDRLAMTLKPAAPAMRIASLQPSLGGSLDDFHASGFVQSEPAIVAPNP